nr:YbhB/YbcL family Raf kinase inhibitor-like protein [uncultured Cupriavidus sp.]
MKGNSVGNFTVTSPEFEDQNPLQLVHEFNGFDGAGQNRSPALQWQGAPEGTQSFALTLYDPDAPTGSGFWHWIVFDIDSSVTQLAAGVGSADVNDRSTSGTQAANDYGLAGYGGPLPPVGLPAHRYIFTVHALGVPKLELPAKPTNAVVRFVIHQNTLATATLTGVYKRSVPNFRLTV